MVDFTADPINFENQFWKCYRSFIEKLRKLVAVRYSHNRAVTPVEVNPPTQFFDIVLQTNNHSIRLRLRRDNLYLVGYQMQDSTQWLELRYDHVNHQHRIINSTFLNFGDSYGELVAAAGVNSFNNIHAGRRELINAINSLATSTNNMIRARSLIIVIVMIVESVRFDAITTYFGTDGSTSFTIPDWIMNYVRGWRSLSAALLHQDVSGHFRLPVINRFGNLQDFEAGVAIIGTMKGYSFGPGNLNRRSANDRQLLAFSEHYHAGRPLVEFFSMAINHINGNYHIIGDIYGAIKVSDGLGDEHVYDRDMNGFESIRLSESVLLNGPSRCITAYDSFTVDVTLMSKNGLSEDDEISKGKIMWEVTNISTNEYDKILFQQFESRFGSATLSYAILSDAVEAMIEVTLVKNGDAADVYGLLTCHNVKLNRENVLFQKKHNKFINVKPGKIIPLSRSVVAVSLNSSFIIRADLKGSNIFSSDDEIAKGIATFSPQICGTHELNIYGNNNIQIQVKVIWSWNV